MSASPLKSPPHAGRPRWGVWQGLGLTPLQMAVYLYIRQTACAPNGYRMWLGIDGMAKDLGFSRDKVKRAVDVLHGKGLVHAPVAAEDGAAKPAARGRRRRMIWLVVPPGESANGTDGNPPDHAEGTGQDHADWDSNGAVTQAEGVDHGEEQSPRKKMGEGIDALPESEMVGVRKNDPRDEAAGPEWCDDETWRTACRLADLIEQAPTGEAVVGSGTVERAVHLACLLDDAGKGGVMRLNAEACERTIVHLAGPAALWRYDAELRAILCSLQYYPDGCYPNVASDARGRPPSRIERAHRRLRRLRWRLP